jgi:hypothetical protein
VDDPQKPLKALIPVAIGILYAVVEAARIAFGDQQWDMNDTIAVILAALTAAAVYFVPNPKIDLAPAPVAPEPVVKPGTPVTPADDPLQ